MKLIQPRRLRVLDIHTPKFWFTIFYEPFAYGEPWFRIEIWDPHSWAKWWLHAWMWEPLPETVDMEGEEIPKKQQDV